MAKIEIPQFETKKELFDFLVENKTVLENQKKSSIKYADGISTLPAVGTIPSALKSDSSVDDPDQITVKAVINTTNLLDSHGDVHINGLWKKSVKENKRMLHVQEHKSNEFDKIISSGDDLQASVKGYSWKELGYNAKGRTQALVFDSVVKRERNPYMFKQYKEGRVDNHSVGMRYVKIALAINDDEYGAEKIVWDKYIDEVANKDAAEDKGYFWAVLEAKAIEGSAVPLGSNPITPTLNIKSEPTLIELINKRWSLTKEKAAQPSTFNILDAINKTNIN